MIIMHPWCKKTLLKRTCCLLSCPHPVCECYLQSRQREIGGPLHPHPCRKQLEHQLPLRQCEQFVHPLAQLCYLALAKTLTGVPLVFLRRRTVAPQVRTTRQRMPAQIPAKVSIFSSHAWLPSAVPGLSCVSLQMLWRTPPC